MADLSPNRIKLSKIGAFIRDFEMSNDSGQGRTDDRDGLNSRRANIKLTDFLIIGMGNIIMDYCRY
jgi:hypothetical protein